MPRGSLQAAVRGFPILGAPREPPSPWRKEQGVARRGVAVDGDGVEGRVRGGARSRAKVQAIAASVKRKASMVAMSGAIMPAPLAMPLMVTGTPSISARRGKLRIGVGGHDSPGGLVDPFRIALGGKASEQA